MCFGPLYVNFYCTKCKFGNTLLRAEGFEFGRLFVCAMTQAGGAGPITSGGKGLRRVKPPKVNLCHLQLAKCETPPPGERERLGTVNGHLGAGTEEISLAKSVPQWAQRAKFRTSNFHSKPDSFTSRAQLITHFCEAFHQVCSELDFFGAFFS